jgi:hypothetical protein
MNSSATPLRYIRWFEEIGIKTLFLGGVRTLRWGSSIAPAPQGINVLNDRRSPPTPIGSLCVA